MNITNQVKLRRRQLGLTQEELSRLSGVGRVTISNIEKGLHLPRIDIAYRLADALKIDITLLFQRGE